MGKAAPRYGTSAQAPLVQDLSKTHGSLHRSFSKPSDHFTEGISEKCWSLRWPLVSFSAHAFLARCLHRMLVFRFASPQRTSNWRWKIRGGRNLTKGLRTLALRAPKTPKKSEKSGKGLEKVLNRHFRDVFQTFSGLFRDFFQTFCLDCSWRSSGNVFLELQAEPEPSEPFPRNQTVPRCYSCIEMKRKPFARTKKLVYPIVADPLAQDSNKRNKKLSYAQMRYRNFSEIIHRQKGQVWNFPMLVSCPFTSNWVLDNWVYMTIPIQSRNPVWRNRHTWMCWLGPLGTFLHSTWGSHSASKKQGMKAVIPLRCRGRNACSKKHTCVTQCAFMSK